MKNTTTQSITDIQTQIIKDFSALGGNQESILNYIIELGNKLSPLEEYYKTEHNVITGCMAKVWLVYERQEDRIIFRADSNAAITKGLIYLLVRVLSNQKINNIITANLHFVSEIGMAQLIGFQRSNGFASMFTKIKIIAMKHQVKKA